ncbi:MAG: alkaline phosphatase family protein [Solirubrobacteraceae bacterium]
MSAPRKLVLAVVDGLKPSMFERALQTGRAPAFQAVVDRGTYVQDGAVAAFPSVTPVCAGAIGTGTLQDRHQIPSMNWFSRKEKRYIEYGSSFSAARRFGFAKQLTDTVFNMNMEHLPADVPTVFEKLDDGGVRTAGTTYLIYRGRTRHEVSRELALTRLAGALWRRHVMGPGELFYADIFASRDTGCRSQLGMPGMRDQHAGCVSSHMVEHDLFDFLLLSLPDNDTHSHKHGPHAQVTSIANADKQLERMMHSAGGTEKFLDEHAVIIVADHSHAKVERRVDLGDAFADWAVLAPGAKLGEAEIALCPSSRAGMVYVLVDDGRHAIPPRLAKAALGVDGIELAMWRDHDRDEGVIASRAGMLRFAPGGDVLDPRGNAWSVDGQLAVLQAELRDGVLHSPEYPNALERVWAALTCPTSGDLLLSAGAGWEFADWGGVDHVGGGSHGSLHRSDSVGTLAYCGVEAPHDHGAWSIADMAPMVWQHFGV